MLRAPLFLALALLAGCERTPFPASGTPKPSQVGDPRRGARLIAWFGCGSCHTLREIPGAAGVVGPPLDGVGRRVYIVGMLRNTPDNLVRWISHPQSVVPGNVMPDMGIDYADARDIAAYLYTQKE